MTDKRFEFDPSISHFTDNVTGKIYCEYNLDKVVDLLNEQHDEIEHLKAVIKDVEYQRDYVHPKYDECRKCVKELFEKNEQLKKELKVYHKVARCSNCIYHNYDWDIDDGYGGEEYEVCDKGNDVTDGICEEWEEL